MGDAALERRRVPQGEEGVDLRLVDRGRDEHNPDLIDLSDGLEVVGGIEDPQERDPQDRVGVVSFERTEDFLQIVDGDKRLTQANQRWIASGKGLSPSFGIDNDLDHSSATFIKNYVVKKKEEDND